MVPHFPMNPGFPGLMPPGLNNIMTQMAAEALRNSMMQQMRQTQNITKEEVSEDSGTSSVTNTDTSLNSEQSRASTQSPIANVDSDS
uniref:Dachshund n=1 Tax=Panagrellus redivivus TaxID=6233 RepID=A0A7E4VQE4_PANRE